MTSAPVTLTVYIQDDHTQKVAINEKIFGVGNSWQAAFEKMISTPGFGGVITQALVSHHVTETEKRHEPKTGGTEEHVEPPHKKESHKHHKKDE